MGKRVGVSECQPETPAAKRAILAHGGLGQPKLNGIHVRVETGVMYSSQGRVMTSCPHLLAELASVGLHQHLEGEIYRHGWSLDQIRAVTSRTKELHPDYQQVSLHVFDLIVPRLSQAARLSLLEQSLPDGLDYVRAVPTTPVSNQRQLDRLLADCLALGYEGYVLRDSQGLWREGKHPGVVKNKPGGSDTYRIVEACPGQGRLTGTLGALVLEDRDGQRFRVGVVQGGAAERARLWSRRGDLPGLYVLVSYKDKSQRGAPSQGAVLEKLVPPPAWAVERRAA